MGYPVGVRIGVLNNLRAGRGGQRLGRILGVLRDHPQVLHVETDGPRSPEALAELARREVDLLVVNGGDGTLQFALTELLCGREFERLPRIAPLCGGRSNMVAHDLGARRDPVRGLRRLLDAARTGALDALRVERPVLRVASNRRDGDEYGLFLGIGMIRRAVELTHREFPDGRAQGLFVGLVTASTIARMILHSNEGILAPDKVQHTVEGEPTGDGAFSLVIASTLRRLILGMNPFWGRGPGAIRFTSIASDARHVGRNAPGILRGRPGAREPADGYVSRNAERVGLRIDCGFTIDGELFAPETDEVVTLTADRRVTFLRA